MPKDKFNDKGIVYKADMYSQNTFMTKTDSSFLLLYEPTWYQAGYFQFYTYVDPDPPKEEANEIDVKGASVSNQGLKTDQESILANIKDGKTNELFQSTIEDLMDDNRDQTFTATTTIVSDTTDETQGLLESRTFKNEYTSPAKYTEQTISILGDLTGSTGSFEWSFSLTVAVIILMIIFSLGVRHFY